MSKMTRQEGGIKTETPTKICDEFWSEFVLIAEYVQRLNNKAIKQAVIENIWLREDEQIPIPAEAEIADVFEWIRRQDLGGVKFSSALLERVDREINTDLRYEIAS